MSVPTAKVPPTYKEPLNVPNLGRKERRKLRGRDLHPKFARDFLWEDIDVKFMTSADFSLSTSPLPMPPSRSKFTADFLNTLDSNAHLFSIVTPIDVDALCYYTSGHPNRPFVDLVLYSLRYGFWPYATAPDFPSVVDQSQDNNKLRNDPVRSEFFQKECKKERDLGRFSDSFPALLPGMACMPMYVVKRGEKFRLITDHSAEPHSLNSLISKEDRAVPLCGLQQFGYALRDARYKDNKTKLVIFKSDVAQAYRQLSMSPYWQMLQAVKLINGSYAINHNNVFGGAASGRCWWSVMSLVLWVAREHFGCRNLLDYIDDTYSWEYITRLLFYAPYQKYMPANQTKLLRCFDAIKVPHDEIKQLSAEELAVLGILVNGNELSFTMTTETKQRLLDTLDNFIRACVKTLRECHSLAGYVNWSLNVYPRLHPGLASLYSKMSGPYKPNRYVHINEEIVRDLTWLLHRIQRSDGVLLLESVAWRMDEADIENFTDACMTGLGMWMPRLLIGYNFDTVDQQSDDHIFFHEAFVVCCAIHWAADLATHNRPPLHRIIIRTDNTNTVDIFNSLKAHGIYNELLKFAVDILLTEELDLRVLHISSNNNTVADLLSRRRLCEVSTLQPQLTIKSYKPPARLLGVSKK